MTMKVNPCNKYKIEIAESKFRCIEANGDIGKGFDYPDVSDNLPKLYVVKRGKEIYYVGITRQDIRKRLRQGFSAQGEHGYHGYKWRHLPEVELLIWTFPGGKIEDAEAIEGEVVYFIRDRTGKWPKYQMEIHFHPRASEGERQVARSILNEVLN